MYRLNPTMQDNTIAGKCVNLVANDPVFTTPALTRHVENPHKTVYVPVGWTDLQHRFYYQLQRQLATRSGNYRGANKVSCKLTIDVDTVGVDGITPGVAPLIAEISLSMPVGGKLPASVLGSIIQDGAGLTAVPPGHTDASLATAMFLGISSLTADNLDAGMPFFEGPVVLGANLPLTRLIQQLEV